MKAETQEMLDRNGYLHAVTLADGRIACVMPLIHTAAIIVMRESEIELGYDDRWCYHSIPAATLALATWQQAATPEPEGWHRHPLSGRRRKDGDPLAEYVLM